MVIQIEADNLLFVTLDEKQREIIEGICSEGRFEEVPKGLRVYDKVPNLYKVIHKLAYTYDIEIV